MTDKLYDLMDWPAIETVVYSEADKPQDVLGIFQLKKGILIQAFRPKATGIKVKLKGDKKIYPMEMVDEKGFFSVYLPGKKKTDYTLLVEEEKTVTEMVDPYCFEGVFENEDLMKFSRGIHYEVYRLLGAHPMKINGTEGVYFSIWVPQAVRVSVVGEFNQWDGRYHQMQRVGESDVFQLFLPQAREGQLYKFEIKLRGGIIVLKTDPYASKFQVRPDSCSVIGTAMDYPWKDEKWMQERKNKDIHTNPLSIYELHLGSFKRKTKKSFYNYRELAPLVIEQVKKLNMTHVEIMPVMEHLLDESWGYETTGYYAPTSRYGDAKDFKYFVEALHLAGIGVILDWVPAHFPKNSDGLPMFNGYPLYEPEQPDKREHKRWGTYAFDYGRNEVSNFLIANGLYWVEEFHVDGLRVDAVSSMLYLDYDRKEGEWTPNMYGGNENLEGIEFIKHLNSIMKKRNPNVIMIAEESTLFGNITKPLEEEGLGFDYRWNFEFMNKSFEFFGCDPLFRKGLYNEFLNAMCYYNMEHYILPFSHDEVVHEKGTMLQKMPAQAPDKYAHLRQLYAFQIVHPGKKLLFMGNELAGEKEWSEGEELEWSLMRRKKTQGLVEMIGVLNDIYQNFPALYETEETEETLEWINNTSANDTLAVFLRKGKNPEDTLLILCNFTPVCRENYKVGVPFAGEYKEIFQSEEERFGGSGIGNKHTKVARKDSCDEREYSLRLKLAPLSVSIFQRVI